MATTGFIAPVHAAPVTPAEWFNSQAAPVFKPGNTLPRLTRFGYDLGVPTQKAIAERWNYDVQLNYTRNAQVDAIFNDPTSFEAQIVALTKSDPVKYPLALITDGDQPASVDTKTFLRDAAGNLVNGVQRYSPLNPQWVIDSMTALRADPLRRLRTQVPINIILNGGEYGLEPIGDTNWPSYDPAVIAAVNAAGGDYFDFQSKAKANECLTIYNAVANAVPDRSLYIYYHSGTAYRNDTWNWKASSFDSNYLRRIGDLPSEEYYYKDFNSGYLLAAAPNDNNDLLTRALKAKGFALTGGTGQAYEKLSYDWLCSGYKEYDPNLISPMDTYTGFLKCLFTAGTLGGNAGFYTLPAGGFDASFDSASPAQWAQQMARLSHVQALFSYLESDVRNGDLLPGPNIHSKLPQPAYEFPTGSAGSRVVARKVTGQNKWIITAWAADGVDRTVSVTIPVLGNIALSARAAGSVYIATIANNQMQLTLTDSNAMTPTVGGYAPVDVTPTQTPNANPAFVNGGFETPVFSAGEVGWQPTGAGWTWWVPAGASIGIQRNGSPYGAPNAPEGSQTALLQRGGASMSQIVNFSAGAYKVTFQAARRSGQVQPIQLKVDGVNVGSPITLGSDSFTLYTSAEFTVIAGKHEINLVTTNLSGDNTSFVDDVRIVVSTSAGAPNGGFETPVLSAGTFAPNPAGAGWSFVSDSGIQRNGSAFGAANAPEGSQTAYLQGSPGRLGEISQLLNLLAGTYTVQFQAAQRSGQLQPIQIKVDGNNVGSTITPTSNSFGIYTSAAFTATAGNHTIALGATDGANDKTSFVDDVQVVTASAAVMSVHSSGTLPDGAGVYDYGTVNVAAPLDHTFTIDNLGARTLTFTGSPYAVVSGTNAADFSVTTQPAATVAGGASTTFIVRFTPSAAGARTATISIASNDAATSPYTFNVTGSGLTAPAAPSTLAATRPANRQINLTWKDNSANESGFKIERATNSTFTTNLVQVATTVANVVTYSNTGLAANTRYYYRIRATNAAGNSAYSNVVNALTGA